MIVMASVIIRLPQMRESLDPKGESGVKPEFYRLKTGINVFIMLLMLTVLIIVATVAFDISNMGKSIIPDLPSTILP